MSPRHGEPGDAGRGAHGDGQIQRADPRVLGEARLGLDLTLELAKLLLGAGLKRRWFRGRFCGQGGLRGRYRGRVDGRRCGRGLGGRWYRRRRGGLDRGWRGRGWRYLGGHARRLFGRACQPQGCDGEQRNPREGQQEQRAAPLCGRGGDVDRGRLGLRLRGELGALGLAGRGDLGAGFGARDMVRGLGEGCLVGVDDGARGHQFGEAVHADWICPLGQARCCGLGGGGDEGRGAWVRGGDDGECGEGELAGDGAEGAVGLHAGDGAGEVRHAWIAVVERAGEGLADDRFGGLGDVHLRGEAPHRQQVVLVDRLPDLALVYAAEGQLAGEELVEDHADGPDVGAVVDRFAVDLFDRHIGVGADHRAGAGEAGVVLFVRGVEELGDAEVEDLDEVFVLLAGDAKAVLRLHVAVDDLGGVGGREGATDLQGDVLRAGPGQRAAAQCTVEALAGEQLHGDVAQAAGGGAGVEDLDGVGVFDAGGDLGLAGEAGGRGAAVDELGEEHLDGAQAAAEAGGLGLVDLAHAAATDGAEDAVAVVDDLPDERVWRRIARRRHLARR